MKREFHFEFEDESSDRALTYEAAADGSDRLTMAISNGVPTLCGNPSGMLVLARILVQMAQGDYANGFHVHLHDNYDPDKPDCLTVILDRTD
ncbi:MAG: hypothetical protein ABSG03_38170 [Bryobacteraceae bacterium]|jgi:hypothetical protein